MRLVPCKTTETCSHRETRSLCASVSLSCLCSPPEVPLSKFSTLILNLPDSRTMKTRPHFLSRPIYGAVSISLSWLAGASQGREKSSKRTMLVGGGAGTGRVIDSSTRPSPTLTDSYSHPIWRQCASLQHACPSPGKTFISDSLNPASTFCFLLRVPHSFLYLGHGQNPYGDSLSPSCHPEILGIRFRVLCVLGKPSTKLIFYQPGRAKNSDRSWCLMQGLLAGTKSKQTNQ